MHRYATVTMETALCKHYFVYIKLYIATDDGWMVKIGRFQLVLVLLV